jgi:virginiamycin A acetyltransferase
MRVRLSQESLEWLYDQRIFFQGLRQHGHRLRPGGFLHWREDIAVVEPYVGIYSGDQIPAIGAFSYSHSTIPAHFSLGRYCSVAWGVKFPGPRHPMELLSTAGFIVNAGAEMWSSYLADTNGEFRNAQPNPQKPGTVIGHDVWIGQDVTIMSGLSIGNGAVIAAASVVTKNIEPFAIVGGNPAQFIRWRFPQEVRDDLAELRWWRYGFSVLNRVDLSNVRNSIRDLRNECADLPEFTPEPVDLMKMPHGGLV